MESSAAMAASIGIALALGVTGLTLVACGLAIRGAGGVEIVRNAPYREFRDAARLNRWTGNRILTLGAVLVAGAAAAFSWPALAVPILGGFGVAGSIVAALIAGGPAAPDASADLPDPRRSPREPGTPAEWLADPERRRGDLTRGSL